MADALSRPPSAAAQRPPPGDLHPTSYNASNNFIFYISIRPPASQRPAAKPTQPLSLPPQSLGGDLCFPASTVM